MEFHEWSMKTEKSACFLMLPEKWKQKNENGTQKNENGKQKKENGKTEISEDGGKIQNLKIYFVVSMVLGQNINFEY